MCRAFPADQCATLQPQALDDPREIVGAPTVTQDQCDGDGLRISACREITRVFAEEVLDAFVDVQLLDQGLQ
jgi:hypothetical protein